MSAEGQPEENATLTIRLIRSFEHRNIRNIVLHNIPLDQTVNAFLQTIRERLKSDPSLPPPFRSFAFDTLKIETHAHGYKTNDPVINREDDETLVLREGRTLRESGVRHETEISFFKNDDYLKYKENPVLVW